MANLVLAKFNPRTKFCLANLVLGPNFTAIFGPTHHNLVPFGASIYGPKTKFAKQNLVLGLNFACINLVLGMIKKDLCSIKEICYND